MLDLLVIAIIFTDEFHLLANSAVQCRLKTMLNLEIYRKSLRRRDLAAATTASDEKKEGTSDDDKNKEAFTIGAVVNLMGTDTSRISDFAAVWFALISAPIQLFVGVYFLYQLMGVSCLYGLLAMIFIVPINHFNTKIFAKTQDKLMEARDKRVSLMTEVLQGIRQIKFFAWESKWEERVMKSRNEELRQLAITYINGVFFSVVWQGAPILVTLVSFYSFTKIEGKQLNTPIAFTAINVFNDLRYALNIIPTSIIELIQARASLKRIERFLNEDEIEAPLALSNKTSVDIGFEKATIGWKKEDKHTTAASSADNEEKASFILKDLSVKFPNHQLSLISGATGSGKTLMLLGLLGEAILIDGQVDCPRVPVSDTIDFDFDSSTTQEISSDDWIVDRSLAYVSQTVWLQNASIRDNILFGLPYLEPRYKETLTACALDKDLSIFEDGDLTEIGEKGITLSGGQKARVTLARAVYSRAGNVLMDDVLSAVDAHTAKHLYEQCLMGPLMKGRTRILVTHHIKLCIKGCSLLVHIGNGRVASVGSPAELREAGILAKIIEEDVEELVDEDDIIDDAGIPRIESSTTLATKDDQKKAPPSARVLVGEESRASGSVKLRLYKSYFGLFGKAGYWIGLASIILASRCLEVGEEWWLKIWAQSYSTYSGGNMTMVDSPSSTFFATIESMFPTATTNDESAPDGITHLNYYLGIFTLITCVNACSGSLRYAYVYWGVLGANRKLYSELLHRVFRAPLRFFDTTPMGRILNRFSKDFESVDSNIPTSMLSFAIQWFVIVTIAMIVCIAIPAFLIPIIIMSIICIYVGINYVTCARELKRLESITRSPIFSNFTETVAGVTTIRAFGASQQFLKVMMESIDANIRPVYCSAAASRWVGLRYSMTSGGIGFVACAITLYYMGHIDVALVGFTLTIVLSFNDNMFAGILMYTGLEMNFNAVERIVEFTEIDQEADAITGMRPPPQWPTHGKIEVKDLQVRYAADLNPVLKGVSFSIKPQEKIGIVGRTGSGKSTLALSFFRFVEASQGSITIDNLNIKDIGTEDLRSNLTIIPQDPTLFSGSLRSNMDPFDEFQDQDIFAALCRVHLIPSSNNPSISGEDQQQDQETVNDNVFKDLDANVSEGGKNFSQGQRQLLCLARALLKSSRVVLMDEATASVDFETDKAIQKTITTEFSDSTILCIAHRLHTVIEYDRILLLDQGKVAEFDSPLTLLRRPDSAFYKMCKKSGEFDQLMELATARSQL
jgi:ABC-type multidrug transport system fused ATPase/permease subunit